MAQYYNSIKTMKTSRIGTIMPWGGNGFSGFSAANIPRGWKICDGSELECLEYPVLAAELGTTYGGSITGTFPNYAENDKFVIPNITNKCMMDLEAVYLSQTKYQYGQGDVLNVVINSVGNKLSDLITGFGTTAVIKTIYSANADIDFTLPTGTSLSGKFTNMDITAPDFNASITTLNRKLGINHTPNHQHPGSFQSATASFFGPALFTSTNVEVSGSTPHPSCGIIQSKNHQCALLPSQQQSPSWQNGRNLIAFYGDNQYEHTLPVLDQFYDFVNDSGKDYWSQVPAPDWHSGTPTRNSPQAPSQTCNFVDTQYTKEFPFTPVKTHAEMAWTGLFPKPSEFANRRNFFGHSKVVYNNVEDNPENSAYYFSVSSVTVTPGVTEISLPAGTDIKSTHTTGTAPDIVTWYQYDKIHPWQLVDGDCFAKGTQILKIERAGTNDSNYVYTITLSKATINPATSTFTVTFREGTWPTTTSNFGDNNPEGAGFLSHNHGTFDIQMSKGNLGAPATHPIDTISIGSINPENLNDALNIIVNVDQPAMNITYLIRAY